MPNMNLNNASSSDMTNNVDSYSITPYDTDGVTNQEETSYQNTEGSKQWAYFNELGEVKSAILMKAVWNVGKGYICDPETRVQLENIIGWGKDTFEDILFNMEVTKRIFGDAFAKIVRNDKGKIVNLRVLYPPNIKIIVDKTGSIERYEQVSRTEGAKNQVIKPKDMFHLSNNRLADQIHGISDIKAMEKIILADAESFKDIQTLMHRQAKPLIMFKLGTDDPTKISNFIAKMDQATNKGENIYIPDDENSVSFEVVQVNPSQVVLEWRNELRNKFYRIVGLPQIIFGSSGSTESGGKMEYLAHEQIFEKEQRELERQIWEQLFIRINLISPVTLLENIQNDQQKDGAQGFELQKSDVTANSGRDNSG